MADRERVTGLGRLLGAAARAHHEATGGPNDGWAVWYAEYLDGKIDEVVGFTPGVDQIAEWLTWADEKHRAEDPEARWPYYYAELILGSLDGKQSPRE